MARKETEIIVEEDEMEDGSIFVCFMCEQEFNKVSALNAHMQMHKNMPEMSKELPSRRRGRGRGSGSTRGPSRGRGRGRGQVKQEIPGIKIKEEIMDDPEEEPMEEEIEEQVVNMPYVNMKPQSSKERNSMLKAQRIRHYFQSRLLGSGKSSQKRSAQYDADSDDGGLGLPLAEDEIMMVPNPVKKKSDKSSRSGPAVISGDPEGFHVPTSVSSRAPKKVKLRKKLIVQEVVYEEVEVDEDDDDGEDEVETVITKRAMPTASVVKRGRPRKIREEVIMDENEDELIEVKRGRPQKIKEEINLLDENEDELIELSDDDDEAMDFPARDAYFENIRKPGRRSQPRSMEEGPGIPCTECGKEFRSITTLRVHMKSHLEVKDIPCPYCDEIFPQRHVLHQHLVHTHKESSNLTCSVCFKVFTRTDSLKSHMVRMHMEDGGLNCYICGKNFPSQGQLEMHVRVHTGERPFKCDYCNKGFVQKVHLRTHLRTMHNMQEIQNTPCRICNAMLDGRAGLRDHYSNVHGLTNNQYKSCVAKLRKEGKIPELPPPVVKEVDPGLNYYKVSVSELTAATSSTPKMTMAKSRRGGARLQQIRRYTKMTDRSNSAVETTTYCDADSTYGAAEIKEENEDDDEDEDDDDDDAPKRRDQEELNIVESAFKVAEQMDQLGGNVPGSTTILVAGEDSATTGVYYAIPVVMENNTTGSTTTTTATNLIQSQPTCKTETREAVSTAVTSTVTSNGTRMISTSSSNSSTLQQVQFGQDEIDDEYAQFAAEHSHMESEEFGANGLNGKGSIVKAEPLQLFTDPSDPSQTETVEMFTM